MTIERFQSMYEDVCRAVDAPTALISGASDDPGQPAAFHLSRQGVMANVLYFPGYPDHAFVLIDFGAIPPDHPRVAQIVLALLEVNFLVPNPNAPAIGRNPVTGAIALRCVVPLATTMPAQLLQVIDDGAELALQWRRDFFLVDEVARRAPETVVPVYDLA
jgi:hypothetical protein